MELVLLDAAGNAGVGLAAGWITAQAGRVIDYVLRRDELSVWLRHVVKDFRNDLKDEKVDAQRQALTETETWDLLGDPSGSLPRGDGVLGLPVKWQLGVVTSSARSH